MLWKNIIKFFEEKEVDLIIIACGTCSSLVDEYRKYTDIKIIDVRQRRIEMFQPIRSNKYDAVVKKIKAREKAVMAVR